MYVLWLVSAFIIFFDEGFSPRQDLPWIFLFTGVLIVFWIIKFAVSRDAKIIYYKNMKNLSTISFFLAWVFGFFALLSFDLFMEGIIFEKLDWNGTTKNDWFFALWWGFVITWFLYGIINLYNRMFN
jgi:hypothetical protein